jgi:hypothetical protein
MVITQQAAQSLTALNMPVAAVVGAPREQQDIVRRAVGYLVQNGPISPQDRWEENSGTSPFTLAIEIVALIAAAEFLSAAERDFVLSLADYWNERIEDWTYVSGAPFASQYGVDGYYVRIGPAAVQGGLCGRVNVANRWGQRGARGVFETFASTSGKAPDRTVEQCRETSASQTGEGPEMALAHRHSIRCITCTTRSPR